MKKLSFFSFLFLFFLPQLLSAEEYSFRTVPNPKKSCVGCFVSNPDKIIAAEKEGQLNRKLQLLEEKTGVEFAIVALNSIEGDDEYSFSHELFNYWKIGKEGKDNGILLLFVKNLRAVKIETGYGVEGLLPDAVCEGILNEVVFPVMRKGDYGEGLLAAVDAVSTLLTTESALEELWLRTSSRNGEKVDYFANYLILAFLFLILFSWGLFFKIKRLKGNRSLRYQKLRFSKNLLLFTVFFFPFPLFFLLRWLLKFRKNIRYSSFECPKCAFKIELMPETTEDIHLDSRQTVEDDLNSIEYDVWQCSNCFYHEVYSYENSFSAYLKCPDCGAKAYLMDSDIVLKKPTQQFSGMGQKTYYCKACMKNTSTTYVIPKLSSPAPVPLGLGGSRGGGFGGGGSFGGGFSGGGGAGGRF